MSDVWSSALYQASYGGVEFDCLATSDSIARALVRNGLPRRNGGTVQDMGADSRTTRCQILFWERAAIAGEQDVQGNHLQRFAAFKAVLDSGRAQDFVHPITGTYRAKVEDYSFDADAEERDALSVTCTFVEDAAEPAVAPGTLFDPYSGPAAMRASADLAAAQLRASGIDPAVADDAASMVDAWGSDPTKGVREVSLELASLNSRIDGMINEYELATDLSKFGLWRNLQALSYTARRAAARFKRSQPQVIQITVASAVPLRVLAAETYGGAGAEAGYSDIMRLNDIEDPLLLEAGTVLRAPSPRSAAASSSRRAA